ncbi:YcaO-like family protein [Streptomyces vinaceus]|uniref:YcaO-like family protein n=1 Tax=Streptomyces vinaceus TaxID=1960 RepID=UPI0035DBCFC8
MDTQSIRSSPSVVSLGTHRVLPPEETWLRLRPALSEAGITRVADVTRLDDIGIPVWQAIRPNAANMSVSQGKGLTPALARVSAAMEAYELHCAERPPKNAVTSSAEALGSTLTYDPWRLALRAHHVWGLRTPMAWVPAEDLVRRRTTWIPREAVIVDLRVRARWEASAACAVSSNGLASGNTLTEATLHGLLEVVERHSLAEVHRAGKGMWASAVTLAAGREGAAARLLRAFTRAEVTVQIVDCTGSWGVPTFLARVWSETVPFWFSGSGTHPDADVAMSRALTEAAQSRLTAIAGARDDLPFIANPTQPSQSRTQPDTPTSTDRLVAAHQPPPTGDPRPRDLDRDLAALLMSAEARGTTVLQTDLTPPHLGIPAVRVVVPGADFIDSAWA